MKRSLQQIQDSYENLGYKGDKLRRVLNKDEEYQKIIKERKQKLTRQFKITPTEKKKYVLSTDDDFEILARIKQLEKKKLSKEDEALVRFLRTQLEDDWRKPLLKVVNGLLKKYK